MIVLRLSLYLFPAYYLLLIMNLHVIAVLGCMALFHEVTCLQCYVCSATPGMEETAGCPPGLPMEDRFLHTCESTEMYCGTVKGNTFMLDGTSVSTISLSCQSSELRGCRNITGMDPVDYTTSCLTSCTTNGCNAHSLTPATTPGSTTSPEVTTTPAVTTTPEMKTKPKVATTPEDKQIAAPTPTSSDAPKPSPDKGTTAIPKSTGFTDAPKTTTSAAQAIRLTMHTVCNLFVSVMCALLLSGLIRND